MTRDRQLCPWQRRKGTQRSWNCCASTVPNNNHPTPDPRQPGGGLCERVPAAAH